MYSTFELGFEQPVADACFTRRRLLGLAGASVSSSALCTAEAFAESARACDEADRRGYFRVFGPEGEHPYHSPTRLSAPAALIRPALVVELDHPYVGYQEGYVRAPTCVEASFVRAYLHEVLHVWQILSQGFLTELALSEWNACVAYQSGATVSATNPLRERFKEISPAMPFSPWNLSEGLCRYWDVHVFGPSRVLRERATITTSPASDRYPTGYSKLEFHQALLAVRDQWADPYRWTYGHWGDAAAVIFPLLGYFALQTADPVGVFVKAGRASYELVGPTSSNVHKDWARTYEGLRTLVIDVAKSETGRSLRSGLDVLNSHPKLGDSLWQHYRTILRRFPGEHRERAFALPGVPDYREMLANIPPALTVFTDGRWTYRSIEPFMRRIGIGRNLESLADEAEAIRHAHRKLHELR